MCTWCTHPSSLQGGEKGGWSRHAVSKPSLGSRSKGNAAAVKMRSPLQLLIITAFAVFVCGECFISRGFGRLQRRTQPLTARRTLAAFGTNPMLLLRRNARSSIFAACARPRKAAADSKQLDESAVRELPKPKNQETELEQRVDELKESDYPMFQQPPRVDTHTEDMKLLADVERSLNRWNWMNITEHWQHVTASMPTPKPIPKQLLKDIPEQFHSWIGRWYGEDMYPVLARAIKATTPMDFTLTNNQAFFDFAKNNFSTYTLQSSRGKTIRLRLPDPGPNYVERTIGYQGGYVPDSEADTEKMPPEEYERLTKLLNPEFPPMVVTAVTGMNETTFRWVNRYFDMIKYGLSDWNITLCHRLVANVPSAQYEIAMWAHLVDAEIMIDGPGLRQAQCFTEEKIFHPSYVADVLERLRNTCIMDDHFACPIEDWERSLTFTPTPDEAYDGYKARLKPKPELKRPYIPGYDFEASDFAFENPLGIR